MINITFDVAASAATGAMGGAELKRDYVETPFADGLLTGLKFTKASRHLYKLSQKVPKCVLRYFLCMFLFMVRLHRTMGKTRWLKKNNYF